jgi:curved DNA-binding protein CbpA
MFLKTKKYDEEPFWKTVYLLYCLGLIDLTTQDDVETEPPVQKPTAIGEQDKNLAEAMELSRNLDNMNHYQVLGVPPDADLEKIKQSYFKLAKKYHPDLFDRNLPLEMRVSIEEVFDHITKAYKVLGDDQERKQYDKSQAKSDVPDQKNLQQRADLNYNRAVALFKRGKYDDARILLKEAVRLNSKKGSFYLLLAMSESKLSQYRREAEEDFLKAIKLEPWNVDSYVGLGLMYKQEGLQVKAEKQFRMALKFDPENRTALKELRISRKDDKKKGLKDLLNIDIFGKKKD